MKVCVLSGGRSSEHEVSLASAQAVMKGLRAAGHEPIDVTIGRDGRWSLGDSPLAIEPGAGLVGCDVCFPVLHGPFGEDGTVQGLLELADVPYVGAGVLASAVCMDKAIFKRLMANRGVPQVDYVILHDSEATTQALEQLGLPIFVKPARMGSSVGITKATSYEQIPEALQKAFCHDSVAVAEAMAQGTEAECSVIGNGDPVASEPGGINVHGDWYDYQAKYDSGGMELLVPAPLAPEVRDRIQSLAVEVFKSVGCSGLARVDFFVRDDGHVLVNELNTMPGFTETSVFAKLFGASGLSYEQLLDRLLELALARHRDSRALCF
jgi:D-alanine-D-alanine ligase